MADSPPVAAGIAAARKALADPWLDSRVRSTVGQAVAAAIRAYDEALHLDINRRIHHAAQRQRYKR